MNFSLRTMMFDCTYKLTGFVSIESVRSTDEVLGAGVVLCACAEHPLALPDVSVALPADRFAHHDVTVTGSLIVAFVLSIKNAS